MKEAILIYCHKNPKQVNVLLDSLNNPDIDLYVHIDRKSGIRDQIAGGKQVHILPEELTVNVEWGTFSQVQATLNLIDYASQRGVYEHYWLCSGQDYPIKSAREIVSFLHKNKSMNYLQLWPSKNVGGV